MKNYREIRLVEIFTRDEDLCIILNKRLNLMATRFGGTPVTKRSKKRIYYILTILLLQVEQMVAIEWRFGHVKR